jgi:hypothetical protein
MVYGDAMMFSLRRVIVVFLVASEAMGRLVLLNARGDEIDAWRRGHQNTEVFVSEEKQNVIKDATTG